MSLGKLREYHGLFKNICNLNFCVDPDEFCLIFKLKAAEDFRIWNVAGNGIVDALELFSGLILFSDAKADEKIRCTPG